MPMNAQPDCGTASRSERMQALTIRSSPDVSCSIRSLPLTVLHISERTANRFLGWRWEPE